MSTASVIGLHGHGGFCAGLTYWMIGPAIFAPTWYSAGSCSLWRPAFHWTWMPATHRIREGFKWNASFLFLRSGTSRVTDSYSMSQPELESTVFPPTMAYTPPHPIALGSLDYSEVRSTEAPNSPCKQWISTPSSTVVSGQATPSPSSSNFSAKSESGTQRRPGRGGRPATARRIWSNPAMQRKLVRLYLYTAQGSLNTKQISKLITDLARHGGAYARSVALDTFLVLLGMFFSGY